MKNKKLLLPILLMGITLTGCDGFSFDAFNDLYPEEEQDAETDYAHELYQAYLDKGGTLSFNDWLDSLQGEKGDSPYIGENGNWWVGNSDTGVKAEGSSSSYYSLASSPYYCVGNIVINGRTCTISNPAWNIRFDEFDGGNGFDGVAYFEMTYGCGYNYERVDNILLCYGGDIVELISDHVIFNAGNYYINLDYLKSQYTVIFNEPLQCVSNLPDELYAGVKYKLSNYFSFTGGSINDNGMNFEVMSTDGYSTFDFDGTYLTVKKRGNVQIIVYNGERSQSFAYTVYFKEEQNTDSLNFSISDLTSSSRATLVNDGEGYKFFGRPIGNDVYLDVDGSVSVDNHEPIFNASQQGSYIGLKFQLTAEQAEKFSSCGLYIDATPAQWMYQNNLDFFARKNGDEDWTPGYYIETTSTHTAGQQITGYRYALYVDNEFQDFDETITNPIKGDQYRDEYLLPYVFKLHEGTNSIRIHCAGGYKSIFHGFSFRPITIEHDHTWLSKKEVVATNESTYRVEMCECGKERIVISAAKDLNNVITYEGSKLPKGSAGTYDGSKIALYRFSVADSVKGHLKAKVGVDSIVNCNESNGYSYYTGKSNGSLQKVLSDNSTNTVMTFNGNPVTLPRTTYYEMGITGTTADTTGIADYGEFTLSVDSPNEFTLAGTNSYGLMYYEFYFEYTPIPHTHNWIDDGSIQYSGLPTYAKQKCSCGKNRIVIGAEYDQNGYISTRGSKLQRGTVSNAYDGTAISKYVIYLDSAIPTASLTAKVGADQSITRYSYYHGKNGGTSIVLLPDGKSNTKMSINGVNIVMPSASYNEMGITGATEDKAGIAEYGDCAFVQGLNTIEMAAQDSCGLYYYDLYIEY